MYSSTVASNGGNVIVGLPRGEASHGFEAGEWSNHAGTGTVDGGNSWGGDSIGFIDIGFGSFLSWMRVIEEMSGRKLLDEKKHPGLTQWAETFAADPAVKGILPETDKLVEFAKILQLKWTAAAAAAAK